LRTTSFSWGRHEQYRGNEATFTGIRCDYANLYIPDTDEVNIAARRRVSHLSTLTAVQLLYEGFQMCFMRGNCRILPTLGSGFLPLAAVFLGVAIPLLP
jgi:hypothetical protein